VSISVHAALYGKLLLDARYTLRTPFPRADEVGGQYVLQPLLEQHKLIVATIKRNRAWKNLDRVVSNRSQLQYECVWCLTDDSQSWLCMFALDLIVENRCPRGRDLRWPTISAAPIGGSPVLTDIGSKVTGNSYIPPPPSGLGARTNVSTCTSYIANTLKQKPVNTFSITHTRLAMYGQRIILKAT
jgi:hypothetical protein